MNKFTNELINMANLGFTENGATKRLSTDNELLDLFGMGAAYRSRSDNDCILLFKKAYDINPIYALKCLFYIGDCRGGQGERRFWRVCARWLASYDAAAMKRNLIHIPTYRRWDDLFIFIDTPLQNDALKIVKHQLALDVQTETPSLLAKWMPSENTSSGKTKILARTVRNYLGLTSKQYRKILTTLRTRINVLEKLMSANDWDKIEFDKIPSKAGLKYKKAFIRHDENQSYANFAKSKTTKVNASTLYPYEVVANVVNDRGWFKGLQDPDRLMMNKYWENLNNYFQDKEFNGLAVIDTSASMRGLSAAAPINVAISLGIYCAERAKGPFAGHYIAFSSRPRMVKVEGLDFVDKVQRIYAANLCENTNIEATFDMLLNIAIQNHCSQDDLPENLIILSDLEFDSARDYNCRENVKTLMENIREKWTRAGYRVPRLIYWNIESRHNNIPERLGIGAISYVSGMSPSIFEQVLSGKNGYDLMMEVLNKDRYSIIH